MFLVHAVLLNQLPFRGAYTRRHGAVPAVQMSVYIIATLFFFCTGQKQPSWPPTADADIPAAARAPHHHIPASPPPAPSTPSQSPDAPARTPPARSTSKRVGADRPASAAVSRADSDPPKARRDLIRRFDFVLPASRY